MAIDYTAGREWATHIRAFAIIESSEDVGKIGDGGRAFGLLQQHPAFVMQWYRDVSVTDTWWNAQIKAAAAFLDHYVTKLGLDLAVQSYNLGASAVEQGQRNPEYLARWTAAFQKLRSGA